MPDRDNRWRGPYAVFMMALHDRAFFESLLKNPRTALTEPSLRGRLHLTPADVDLVVRMIEAGGRRLSVKEGLAIWDRWKATGVMGTDDWPDEDLMWPST